MLPLLVEDCQTPILLKDKKYADFRIDFDRGLLELLSAVDPTEQISAAALNIDEDFARGVARLLARAHSEEPLSSLLVEVMEFARARRLKRLHNFCFGEIQGYHDEESVPEEVSEVRAYRVIEYFASKAGPINPNYVGFGSPTGLFNYIDANPDKFVPVKVIDRDGVAAIEHGMMSQSPSSTALYLKRPLRSINPEAADPDRTIHLYAKPDTYSFMAHSIRRQLIQMLVTLLPPM